jgi:F-type H+-transporting ATPase subunit gamma
MTQRLAEVGRRITSVRQLGAVVNAMRGIAGTHAQQSRARLPAIRAYADTAARAIAEAARLDGGPGAGEAARGKPGLIVFGAEQGFAGAFPELVLNAAMEEAAAAHLFLIGSRTAALAAERGLPVGWDAGLPSSAAALADAAMAVVDAVYAYLSEAGPVPVAMVYPVWAAGGGAQIVWQSLLPLDVSHVTVSEARPPPLTNLPPAELIARLAQEYIFALLCEATVEAFAAENEARAATMATAKTNIDGKLAALEAEERRTRQEEITAEVVELAGSVRFHR